MCPLHWVKKISYRPFLATRNSHWSGVTFWQLSAKKAIGILRLENLQIYNTPDYSGIWNPLLTAIWYQRICYFWTPYTLCTRISDLERQNFVSLVQSSDWVWPLLEFFSKTNFLIYPLAYVVMIWFHHIDFRNWLIDWLIDWLIWALFRIGNIPNLKWRFESRVPIEHYVAESGLHGLFIFIGFIV